MGALPILRIGDLKPIEKYGLCEITVYSGYQEEYVTFCTPECRKAIDSYLEYRKRCGENIIEDSPLLREQFNPVDIFKVKYARPITIQTIAKTLRYKLVQSGIREIKKTGDYSGARYRKEIPMIHGFRKFFNTTLMNSDVHPLFKELTKS